MKLLYCSSCHDVFKLNVGVKRTCMCGRVWGEYTDDCYAITNGKGISLAIGNGSLLNAIYGFQRIGDTLERDEYVNSEDVRVFCWVRPNAGSGNPHTKVVQ